MALKNQLTTSNYLDIREYQKLLAGLRKDKEYIWELYARLSFYSACRASDVRHFKWGEVLKPALSVTEQKTQKTRGISLSLTAISKIQELYKLMGCPDKDSYVFLNEQTGKPYSIQYINQKLKMLKYRYAIHIEHFSTHTFRKTFGRYVYESHDKSPESLILLNQILKHSSIEMTKRYIGITQDEIDNVFNSITI